MSFGHRVIWFGLLELVCVDNMSGKRSLVTCQFFCLGLQSFHLAKNGYNGHKVKILIVLGLYDMTAFSHV